MSEYLDPFPYLDEPVFIANPLPYAERIEGDGRIDFEPVRLPPPVGPLAIALAAVAGMASWLLVLGLVALLGRLS